MLTRLTAVVLRAPRAAILGALLFVLLAGAVGIPAVAQLPAGGYDVPGSESVRAQQVLADKFDADGFSLVFTITAPDGVDSPAARARAQSVLDALRNSPDMNHVVSYWDSPRELAAAMVGTDHHTGLVMGMVAGEDTEAMRRAHEIAEPLLGDRDGVSVTAGGQAMALYEINKQSQVDAVAMDLVAIPLTFAALVWIFGSAIAAFVPLVVSMFAIVGTALWLRVLVSFTDVSVFAVNLAQALGLALAIDYTLFIITRYREELAAGQSKEAALARTMRTAGRTVAYSALIVAVAMSVMLVFPMYFMRSLAFGGLGVIAFCLIGALVVAPALIVLLGDRLDRFDVRVPVRRWLRRPAPVAGPLEQSVWYRTASFAMRRALPVICVLTALFAAASVPVLGGEFGYPDDRALPGSAQARRTGDILRADFTVDSQGTARIVFPDGVPDEAALTEYAAALSRVDGVVAVAIPGALVRGGQIVARGTYDAAVADGAAYLSVSTTKDPFSDPGRDQLRELRAVPAPGATLFDGLAQRDIDALRGITDHLPLALALLVAATYLLLLLMTGSVLLPVKAIAMNALSLTAAVGVMIWVFQEGHLGGLGTTATGHTVVTLPPLVGCVAFGLAMDYEVFVLSRVREEWLASDRSSEAGRRAVARGLARTGRIVTAAAAVMSIAFAAMMVSQVSLARALGFGLTVAVLIDAFLIRVLLVPAFMGVMGKANWWAPAGFARWHRTSGLAEEENAGRDEAAAVPEGARL